MLLEVELQMVIDLLIQPTIEKMVIEDITQQEDLLDPEAIAMDLLLQTVIRMAAQEDFLEEELLLVVGQMAVVQLLQTPIIKMMAMDLQA